MKRIIILLALVSMTFVGMAQQKCHITGHLDNVPSDSLMVLVMNEENATELTDSIPLHDGNLDYTVECHETMRKVYLSPKQGNLSESMRQGYMVVPAMPGQNVVLKGSTEEYALSGDAFYQDFDKWDKISTPIEIKMNDLQEEYKKRLDAGEDQEAVGKEMQQKYETLQKEWSAAAKNFIRTYPSSHVSGYLLPQVPADGRGELLSLLSDDVKQGPTAPWLKSTEKMEAARAARKENAKSIQPGLAAPEFELPDLKGAPLALSSLRGKYVVLDFWGSWCGWCIKGMPEMKKYYEKYKDKLEIVGVDCRDTEERWKAAVEKNKLPWLHVRCDKECNVVNLYAVDGFPTKIIIDPEGKIAKVIVGENPAFYSFLDELFK